MSTWQGSDRPERWRRVYPNLHPVPPGALLPEPKPFHYFPLANPWYPHMQRGEAERGVRSCTVAAHRASCSCTEGGWDAIHVKGPIQAGDRDSVRGRQTVGRGEGRDGLGGEVPAASMAKNTEPGSLSRPACTEAWALSFIIPVIPFMLSHN